MAQMKEYIKTPEKEVNNEEIANLSDAEFKTLVVKMLTKMSEYNHKIKEEVKTIQSKIKNIHIQGTTVKERKLGLKSTIWNKRKK